MASVRTAERASNRTTCPALTWTPFHSGRPSHAELDLLDPIATLACAARGNTGAHVGGSAIWTSSLDGQLRQCSSSRPDSPPPDVVRVRALRPSFSRIFRTILAPSFKY